MQLAVVQPWPHLLSGFCALESELLSVHILELPAVGADPGDCFCMAVKQFSSYPCTPFKLYQKHC